MTKLKIIIATTLVALISSCNTKENKTTEIKIEEHQHSIDQNIELNNGEKWKVDSNMLLHIRNMEKDVVVFESNNVKDYKLLATKLNQNIDLLTSNCTMKGQAHNELHKWLVPFIELVKNFSGEDSTEQFKEIQHSFKIFNQYFQ